MNLRVGVDASYDNEKRLQSIMISALNH